MRRLLRSTNVIATAAISLALLGGCPKKPDKPKPADASKPKAAAPSAGLDKAPLSLANTVKMVIKSCTISEQGMPQACKGGQREVINHLRRAERSLGLEKALVGYCEALADKDPSIRRLAAVRLEVVGSLEAIRSRSSRKAFDCLVDKASALKEPLLSRAVGQVGAYLGSAIGLDSKLFKVFHDTKNKEGRKAAYGAIWPLGRLRTLSAFGWAMEKSTEPLLQFIVIRSFDKLPPANDKEKEAVCGLLTTAVKRGLSQRVVTAAALRAARFCPDRAKAAEIVFGVYAKLQKHKLDSAIINAVGEIVRADAKQKAKALKLLTAGALDPKQLPVPRGSALQVIVELSPAKGRQLARGIARRRPKPDQQLAQVIEAILKNKSKRK